VYKAQELDTGNIFAVKEAVVVGPNSNRDTERLQVEIEICRSLRHPNIVSYLGSECTGSYLYIFLEYVPGGSVAILLQQFGALNNALLRKATQGCVEGLSYLHTRSPPVVHRDLKGANLLVDTQFNIKLADFGCSKQSYDTKSFTTIGSVPWMAPEVIQHKVGHGRKADIWSLGCTVLEMATAEKPWGDGMFDNIMFALRHIGMTDALPSIPDRVPEWCRGFVQRCVRRDVDQRPNTRQLLELFQ